MVRIATRQCNNLIRQGSKTIEPDKVSFTGLPKVTARSYDILRFANSGVEICGFSRWVNEVINFESGMALRCLSILALSCGRGLALQRGSRLTMRYPCPSLAEHLPVVPRTLRILLLGRDDSVRDRKSG
jgi:hypothetical protein